MEVNRIIQGDSLAVLKTLESESVDCVVTSPPYWGLRDYGTARWEGGDEKCDHIGDGKPNNNRNFIDKGGRLGNNSAIVGGANCKLCGATKLDRQLGLEKTPEEYVAKMVAVFSEVKRVLKKEGTLWLNLGDSYNGNKTGNTETNKNPTRVTNSFKKEKSDNLKEKDLVGIPWRVAFALQADGWYLRQDIIWAKPNPMPESVQDRCTKSHEYIFLMTKSPKYYFDNEAIREPFISTDKKYPAVNTKQGIYAVSNGSNRAGGNAEDGRNKRSVWTVNTHAYSEAHFATFPEKLIEPMVLAGCPKDGLVLDIFMGAGTTAVVAKKLGRKFLGIELNPKYIEIAEKRISGTTPPLF